MSYPTRLELTCVCCPMGCSLLVEKTSDAEATYLSGAGCARGKKYGVREAIRPERVVTTTVFVAGVAEPLSVRTSAPVPRELMGQVVAAAKRAAEACALPVRTGDVVVRNVCGTGADVIATKDVEA
ncbi:DUF1667 domain-containing protein [uncultured Parolsenella sp.]|uniref:DUF1667 domain-containing protein n=1 Tax=uncultured Parolsenella sp. TaxID=2083008 RepID=UPI0027DD71B2|nr:DUF1667 domain-containing protein [uncultured Parolsenella sp.]